MAYSPGSLAAVSPGAITLSKIGGLLKRGERASTGSTRHAAGIWRPLWRGGHLTKRRSVAYNGQVNGSRCGALSPSVQIESIGRISDSVPRRHLPNATTAIKRSERILASRNPTW